MARGVDVADLDGQHSRCVVELTSGSALKNVLTSFQKRAHFPTSSWNLAKPLMVLLSAQNAVARPTNLPPTWGGEQ